MAEFSRNAPKVFKWLIYKLGGEATVDSKMDFCLVSSPGLGGIKATWPGPPHAHGPCSARKTVLISPGDSGRLLWWEMSSAQMPET